MQKWIGVGKIDGEPMKVQYGNQECLLIWICCPRSWSPKNEDNIPVIFIGKRKKALEQAGINKFDGTLVYVIGEISSRIKIIEPKAVSIGVCVFATSITFWDTKSILDKTKCRVNNEAIFDTSGIEEIEVMMDEKV